MLVVLVVFVLSAQYLAGEDIRMIKGEERRKEGFRDLCGSMIMILNGLQKSSFSLCRMSGFMDLL